MDETEKLHNLSMDKKLELMKHFAFKLEARNVGQKSGKLNLTFVKNLIKTPKKTFWESLKERRQIDHILYYYAANFVDLQKQKL